MLPTRTYCSKFIARPYSVNSFCIRSSKLSASLQRDVIFSAISHTLSMLYYARGAMSSTASAWAGTNIFPLKDFTISSVFKYAATS